MLFHQRDDGFACVRPCGTPYGDLFGVTEAISRRFKGAKRLKIARPPHNSGLSRNHVRRHEMGKVHK